jgi:hypothetical protein
MKHISKFEAFLNIMRDARNAREVGTVQLGAAELASVRLFSGPARSLEMPNSEFAQGFGAEGLLRIPGDWNPR